jgi:3-hydroxyisobutyrate dehydrogenase-like beta-hydroxyacid dehydrogenase
MGAKIEISANSNSTTTVGILYCGEMGSAFGKLLRRGGLRVITTCQGRSRVTEEQAQSSGIEILPRLEDVVAQSHFVFSLVLPSAAVDVARQYISCHQMRPRDSVFVEANSIGLETLEQIHSLMVEQKIPLVDAAIHGVAHRLEDLGVLHISGSKAGSLEAICHGLLRVNLLGTQIGSASRMKLLMSAIAKSMAALFLEVGGLAERADMLESFLESCHHFYPSLMTVMERTLLTYPRHAARRVAEIRDIEQMGRALHLRLGMTHEAGELIRLIASLHWDQVELESPGGIRTIVEAVAKACPPENRSDTFSEVSSDIAKAKIR